MPLRPASGTRPVSVISGFEEGESSTDDMLTHRSLLGDGSDFTPAAALAEEEGGLVLVDVTAGQPHRALYRYEATDEDELGLGEGEEVTVLLRNEDGWWYGISRATGARGYFPSTYVQPL